MWAVFAWGMNLVGEYRGWFSGFARMIPPAPLGFMVDAMLKQVIFWGILSEVKHIGALIWARDTSSGDVDGELGIEEGALCIYGEDKAGVMRGDSTRAAAKLRSDKDGHGSHNSCDNAHVGAAIAGYCPRNSELNMKGDADDDDDDGSGSALIFMLLLGDSRIPF